jgi:gluconolactonase
VLLAEGGMLMLMQGCYYLRFRYHHDIRRSFPCKQKSLRFCSSGVSIKCDVFGNVYSGCGDGVEVWNPAGSLIGRILVPGGVANFCFGKDGELFLCAEQKLWRLQLAKTTKGALLGV